MSERHSTAKPLTSSAILEEVGDAFSAIRQEDRLTWVEMARIIGKSDDQVAKYADGSAEIGIVAYTLAEQAWNGRFTGKLRRRVHDARPNDDTGRARQSKLCRAALAMAEALEDDEEITADEVRKHRKVLEDARDAIMAELAKLTVRAA